MRIFWYFYLFSVQFNEKIIIHLNNLTFYKKIVYLNRSSDSTFLLKSTVKSEER